jgi:hypothetical protein
LLQAVKNPRRLVGIFCQVVVDQLAKWIKDRALPVCFRIGRQCLALNVLFYGVAMNAEHLGNLALT